jgi:transcription-repair coupling factor (superfamily II helicase)
VKLTASKDGLQMDMDDFKRFNEKLSDLLLLSLSDYNSNIEDQVYFEGIREKYLECCADVKTRIGDLTQERLEMLSQKASNSVTSRMSRLSRASYVSSKQAAANAAALKEKMLSLKRKQIIERQQEELKHQQEELKHHQRELEHHQRELEWQVEQEQLQGEINAAEVLHQTLLGDTMLLSSNTQPASNTLHENTTEVSQLPTITKDMNTGTSSDMTTPSIPTTPLNPTTPQFGLPKLDVSLRCLD